MRHHLLLIVCSLAALAGCPQTRIDSPDATVHSDPMLTKVDTETAYEKCLERLNHMLPADTSDPMYAYYLYANEEKCHSRTAVGAGAFGGRFGATSVMFPGSAAPGFPGAYADPFNGVKMNRPTTAADRQNERFGNGAVQVMLPGPAPAPETTPPSSNSQEIGQVMESIAHLQQDNCDIRKKLDIPCVPEGDKK